MLYVWDVEKDAFISMVELGSTAAVDVMHTSHVSAGGWKKTLRTIGTD